MGDIDTGAFLDGGADLADRVRRRCAAVAETAELVTILPDRLSPYAAELADVAVLVDPTDPVLVDVGDEEATCLFVLALDAINFGSGWFPLFDKRPGHSGYHTVAAGLADHVRSQGLTVESLTGVDRQRIGAITGQRPDGPVAPLLDRFVESWRLLGTLLRATTDGSARGFVAGAGGSAVRLAQMLVDAHPMYDDAPVLGGERIPLYKRAQITAADLHHAFGGTGPGRFHDLDRLTMFADNLVPHVLRLDGIIRFDDCLVDRITSGELLQPGEPAEVEIRAVAVHAVELLVEASRAGGSPMDAMTLDGVLWHRGAGQHYKSTPRHRCRTTAY